jgi:hypothetical protein
VNPFADQGLVEIAVRCVVETAGALYKVGQRDLYRALRPYGEGSFSCLLFHDYGVQSWIAAEREVKDSPAWQDFDGALKAHEAVLQISGGSSFVSRSVAARDWVLSFVAENHDLLLSGPEDIERRARLHFAQVRDVLERGAVKVTGTTLIAGLRLSPDVVEFSLPDGSRVRKLPPHEIELLSRFDASMEGGLSIHELSQAVVFEWCFECPIALVEAHIEGQAYPSSHADLRHRVERFLNALSIVASHRCEAVQTRWVLDPKGLPVSFGTQSRLDAVALGGTDLDRSQVDEVAATYAFLPAVGTGRVGVAASRLTSAERRLEQSDRLLDAVIGIEALLEPRDYGELNFRVALNFALLGGVKGRRLRYEQMDQVLKARNALVHGGGMSSARSQSALSEAAASACVLLRDALQKIRELSAGSEIPKLDKDYWLTQLLGPKS